MSVDLDSPWRGVALVSAPRPLTLDEEELLAKLLARYFEEIGVVFLKDRQ